MTLRCGDPRKARGKLGFEATIDLYEGLRRTVAWARQHGATIERCIVQHRKFLRELKTAAE